MYAMFIIQNQHVFSQGDSVILNINPLFLFWTELLY